MTELSDQIELPGVQVERPGIQEQEWLDLRGNGENKYFLMHWYPTCLLYTSPSPRDRG